MENNNDKKEVIKEKPKVDKALLKNMKDVKEKALKNNETVRKNESSLS